VVVSHDPVLNSEICRGPGKPAAIRQLTLAELRQWDCGALRNPRFPRQEPVPGALLWASSLLSVAHGTFMHVFMDWLDKQPGAELRNRRFDPKTLYARAFEYTATGAANLESARR